MTDLLTKNTYELDKLMHMFMPVFEQHSYEELLSKIDPKLDLAKLASKKIKDHPEKYNLSEMHIDPWLYRVMLQKNHATANYSDKLLDALNALSKNTDLTDGQQLVFEEILISQKPISTIKGKAGTGKSFATAELIKELIAHDAKTLVLAPTHVAVTSINQLIDQMTGSRFDQNLQANRLVDKDKNTMSISTLTSWTFRNKDVIEKIVAKGATTKPITDNFDMILVDEAYATDGALLLDVFIYGFYTNTPVVLIGDPNQLASISNRPKQLLIDLENTNVLKNTTALVQIMRTNEASIINMAHAVMNGDVSALSKFYTKPDNITKAASLMTPSDFDSNYWLNIYLAMKVIKDSDADPFAAIILVPTNALRITLNNIIQELLINQKKRDATKSLKLPNGIFLLEKDVIMVSETQEVTDLSKPSNKTKVRLRGATRIQITDINPKTANGKPFNKYTKNTLTWRDLHYRIGIYAPDLDRHLVVDLFELSSSGYNPGMYDPDIHELYHDLQPGYAATVNKVQGLSIDHVQVYLDKPYPHVSRNLLYSGVTRARKSIELITEPKTLQKAFNKIDNTVN